MATIPQRLVQARRAADKSASTVAKELGVDEQTVIALETDLMEASRVRSPSVSQHHPDGVDAATAGESATDPTLGSPTSNLGTGGRRSSTDSETWGSTIAAIAVATKTPVDVLASSEEGMPVAGRIRKARGDTPVELLLPAMGPGVPRDVYVRCEAGATHFETCVQLLRSYARAVDVPLASLVF